MLKQRALIALIWSALDVFLRHGLQLVISVLLARLLAPEVFGTLAVLYLFTAVASVVADGGLSGALIQSQATTRTDESTVFWFNAVVGFAIASLLWLTAAPIADFYRSPMLEPLAQLYAINLWIGFLGAVPNALLTKRLDFKSQLLIGAVAMTCSGTVGVVMAIMDFGVWALAVQTLVATILTTGMLWLRLSWFPLPVFSFDSARRLFRFGGFMLLSGMMEAVFSRLHTLLIGRFYSVAELAFYSRADSTKQIPVGIVSGILSRVALPVFSSAANDPAKLRTGLQLALRAIMLVNTPMMLGLFVCAEEALVGVFGAQWIASAPVLRILCLDALLWPFHILNLNVLLAQGHANLFFRLGLLKQGLGILLLLAGSFHGVEGIACGQVAYSCISCFINAHYTGKLLHYGLQEQIKDTLPVLMVAAFMALVVFLVNGRFEAPPLAECFLYALLGTIVYVGGLMAFRVQAFYEVKVLLLNMGKRESALSRGR